MSVQRIQIYPIRGGGVRACSAHNETTPPPDRLRVRHRRRRRHQRRRRQRRRGRRRSTTVKHKVSGRVQGVHVAVIRRRRRRSRSRNHRRHRLLIPSFSCLPTPLPVIRCTRDTRSHPSHRVARFLRSRNRYPPRAKHPSSSSRPIPPAHGTPFNRPPPDGSRARSPTMTC